MPGEVQLFNVNISTHSIDIIPIYRGYVLCMRQVDMYRVAALYIVERYKPHILQDLMQLMRMQRITEVCTASWSP